MSVSVNSDRGISSRAGESSEAFEALWIGGFRDCLGHGLLKSQVREKALTRC